MSLPDRLRGRKEEVAIVAAALLLQMRLDGAAQQHAIAMEAQAKHALRMPQYLEPEWPPGARLVIAVITAAAAAGDL